MARGLSGAYLAARHASRFGDYEAAAEYYVKALARDRGNPELLENAILSFTGLGQINGAVPIARQMQSLGYDSQIANMLLMVDQLDRDAYDAVLADVEAGRSVGPLVDGLVTAWAQMGQGKMSEAVSSFDAASEATGLQAFGLYHKALAKATAGDFEGAAEIMSGEAETPLRLTRRGIIAYAQVLSQLDRNAAAIELIGKAYGPDPDPGLSALVAQLEAGEQVPFTMIRSAKDGLAEVFFTVAGALNGEASDGYTLLYARMAEHLRPGHVDAILLSADLLESQGQYALATAAYDKVPREDPAFHAAELGRAAALRASGKVEAAIEVLEQLAESHGQIPAVHITLGDTLRQQERYDDASKAYDAAIALFDAEEADQWVVFYTRGITHEREKRWDLAEADFRKALELNPGQPQVLNYLGYSFVEMNTNLDEALAMIEEAVAARPDSGYITDSLGWVLYRLGRYDEAVPHMERAAELMPVDAIVNDHLGDVYWAVGRTIEAEFQWRRALSFDPEEKDATRIRRKLEVGLDVVLAEEGAEPLAVAHGNQ